MSSTLLCLPLFWHPTLLSHLQEISAWHLTVKQKRKRAVHTGTQGFRPGDFINLAQLEAHDNYALNFTYLYRINAIMGRVGIKQEWEQPKNFLIWVSFSGSWSHSHIIELFTIMDYYSNHNYFDMAQRELGKKTKDLSHIAIHMWYLMSDKIPAPPCLATSFTTLLSLSKWD